MAAHSGKKFAEKHGPDAKPDSLIRDEILKNTKDNELPCAVAFEIAKSMGVLPKEVGKTADLMNFRIVKCQMGLFGYKPESKAVKPHPDASRELKDAILNAMVNERLPCKSAWEIGARLDIGKMTVSGACEAMNLKIKPCQLGAF
ncbi:MAG: hypothetical protein BWK80_10170 [Desulfobacteraceae bacterium IS3]|nr:MAG: hypothetical protein BWK80_10170 [Desulfobacteraceae bacterium IS3]